MGEEKYTLIGSAFICSVSNLSEWLPSIVYRYFPNLHGRVVLGINHFALNNLRRNLRNWEKITVGGIH